MEGGCTCRNVRYRLTGRPLIVHACHCTWCQRETGTAHALNAMYEAERVEHIAAEPEIVGHTVGERQGAENRALPHLQGGGVEQLSGRGTGGALRPRRHAGRSEPVPA
nr:GFA family protein [Bradyrhizobium elkanii]